MIQDLPSKNMKELRAIAKELGLQGVKAESAHALRTRITLHLQPGLLNELNKNPVLADKKPVLDIAIKPHWLSAQEVIEALRPYQKLQIMFYDVNGNKSTGNCKTWHIKNGPAEDSGSMTMPLHIIKVKAEIINGARFPAKHGKGAGELEGALSV